MRLVVLLVVLFFCSRAGADEIEMRDAQLAPLEEQSGMDVDVELKFTMPAPLLNGYFYAITMNMGVQFNKLIAVEMRGGVFSRDIFNISRIVAIDMGLVPVLRDKRKGVRGWVSQAGASMGYGLEWGTKSDEEGSYAEHFRYHYMTGNLIFKATHWWKKHLGFIFQIRLVGGVSVHTWYKRNEEDENELGHSINVTTRFVSRFKFNDRQLAGLRFFLGVVF